jgi:hypothetical protein
MTTGVLSWPDMRRAIMLNTGFFETNQYNLDDQMRIIAGNWDGAGMSAGNLQYNYAFADRLTELFVHLLNNHDSVVRGVFGTETALYDEFRTVQLTYTNAQKIAWGGTVTDPNNGHRLIEPWKTILGNLMVTPECYDKYFEMMDAYYVPNALELFKQLNCTSRAALASIFDLSVNRGRYYPCNTIVWEFENIDARTDLDEAGKEAEKIKLINLRGNDTTNGITATTWKQRREAQAYQGGDYWGSPYDPEVQFDINQEPALPEKVAGFGNDIKLGTIEAKNLYFGTTPIQSIYFGANLLGNAEIKPYLPATVPNTQFRTNPNSYLGMEGGAVTIEKNAKVWIDVQNFVACKTYYTLDGSDPTPDSTRYTDGITFGTSGAFTLKAITYNMSGVAEAVKTLAVTVNAFAGWRYVRFVGHGDQTGYTTRLVELQALEGATNRLLNKVPLAGYAAVNGGAIGVATDGARVHAPGYPLWWSAEGTPDLRYDLGAPYLIDTINVTGYSPAVDPRTTQFKVYVSTDNTNWTQVVDYSANATNQPEAGFNFPVPQG